MTNVNLISGNVDGLINLIMPFFSCGECVKMNSFEEGEIEKPFYDFAEDALDFEVSNNIFLLIIMDFITMKQSLN